MKTFLISALLVAYTTLGSAVPHALKPVKHTHKDVRCLAENIYHEARGEPFMGQLAVAQVTVNRFQTGKYGQSICAVVHQKHQFSWTSTKPRVRDAVRWQDSYNIAQFVLSGSILRNFPALFYHAKSVSPIWGRKKTVVRVINNHVFYS